jgi:hypothetical protein
MSTSFEWLFGGLLSLQLCLYKRLLIKYIQVKRVAFPRFYFLGDDDMLEILGQSTNPAIIQNHLKKLFQVCLLSFLCFLISPICIGNWSCNLRQWPTSNSWHRVSRRRTNVSVKTCADCSWSGGLTLGVFTTVYYTRILGVFKKLGWWN